jgi:hypothetical protein
MSAAFNLHYINTSLVPLPLTSSQMFAAALNRVQMVEKLASQITDENILCFWLIVSLKGTRVGTPLLTLLQLSGMLRTD